MQIKKIKETGVQSQGWEDLLEKETATHSSIPGLGNPRAEETGSDSMLELF